MCCNGIIVSFGFGGIIGMMVDLYEKGLIKMLFDIQFFDGDVVCLLVQNLNYVEIFINQYVSLGFKGVFCECLNVVMFSVLEIDIDFNVNVMIGFNGVLCGVFGGYSDIVVGVDLIIIIVLLVCGCIFCVVEKVLICVMLGVSVDVLVIDYGIVVNLVCQDLIDNLCSVGILLMIIEELQQCVELLIGKLQLIEFIDWVVVVVCYCDGLVIDVIYQVKNSD